MASFQNLNLKKYDTITLQNRKTLVKIVIDQERSISKSAKKLGIKLSTAKLIIKKYRQSGTFFEKKCDRLNRQRAQSKIQQLNRNSQPQEMNNAPLIDSLSIPSPVHIVDHSIVYPIASMGQPSMYFLTYYSPHVYWM